jgi:hypothetical protein
MVDSEREEHPADGRNVVECVIIHALTTNRQVDPTWKRILPLIITKAWNNIISC